MQQTLTSRLLGPRGSRLLATRRGTVAVGAAAAVLAAILLVVYLDRYRESVRGSTEPTPVLVANKLIPKGTPVTAIASQSLFQPTSVPRKYAKVGSVNDVDALRGRVATEDIYPGQQLTLSDFTAGTTNAIPTQLTGAQRAISLSLDPARALVGHVQSGDRVDVYVGMNATFGGLARPVVKLLLSNVFVLVAPTDADRNARFVLRVRGEDAGRLAFASEHGSIWLVGRPSAQATQTKPAVITAESVLFGAKAGAAR